MCSTVVAGFKGCSYDNSC